MDYDTELVTNSDGVSHTMPVYEGYALPHAIIRLVGRDLAEHLTKILIERGCSFTATAERDIVRDVMEKPSYIDLDHDTELETIAEIDKKNTLELPERTIIPVGAERFHCVDILFQPIFTSKEASGFHDTSCQHNMK